MSKLNRRAFLKVSGMTGLTIAVSGIGSSCTRTTSIEEAEQNWLAWLNIDHQGEITIQVPRTELGQGTTTGLAMLVAEELDADWSKVHVRPAPMDEQFGPQRTEASHGIRLNWTMMRQLGAIARLQLLAAAAGYWRIDPATCITNSSNVVHESSNRSLSYGELVTAAAEIPLPDHVDLKQPKDFKLIGKPVARIDIPAMTNGSLKYAADITLPGLLIASVLHSPKLGGHVAAIDDEATLTIPAVKQTVNLKDAVAVVAEDYWSAEQGLKALKVRWTPPDQPALGEDAMWQLLKQESEQHGKPVYQRGNIEALSTNNNEVITQEYRLPYYAHACMETMTCVANVKGHSCEIWASTQDPWGVYHEACNYGLSSFARLRERIWFKLTRRASEHIKIHAMPVGGGFGRKLYHDVVRESIIISKAVKAPVKLIWSRKQDIRSDKFQPASYHHVQATLNRQGQLSAWYHRITGSGILSYQTEFPYRCENVSIQVSRHRIGVPTGTWRSISDTPNAYARENFMNHLCRLQQQDPVEYRLSLLLSSRMKQTLEVAAKAANWFVSTDNMVRGVAIHESRGSYVAQIIELELQENKAPLIKRVVCAIDCGFAVNPDSIKAQMEGSIVFGLSTILSKGIQVKDGEISQSNFHDFKLLRINEMPQIEVHIIDSAEPPGGVGESGMPPLAPALCGALMGRYEISKLQR